VARRHSGVLGGNRRRVSGVVQKTSPPLAFDASSVNYNGANHGGQTAAQSSSTFDPPAGSLVIVNVLALSNVHTTNWSPLPTITDSLGTHLAWTAGPVRTAGQDAGYGTGWFTFWAPVVADPGPMTATVTVNIGSGGQALVYIAVAVDVWDNALSSGPFGASATGFMDNVATLAAPITPTAKGSALVLLVQDTFINGAETAGAGSYVYANTGGASSASLWSGTSGGPTLTTSLGATDINAVMAAGGSYPAWLVYEVLAA
jgi:hypothetical protein